MHFHFHATQVNNKTMDYSLRLPSMLLNNFELETFSLPVQLCSISQIVTFLPQSEERDLWLISSKGKNLVSGHKNPGFKFLTLTAGKTKPKR